MPYDGPCPTRRDNRHGLDGVVMQELFVQLRMAWRSLFRTPLFACVALLIVALGIATNAVIFSVANAVLFRSLPLHEPDRLVRVFEQSPDGDQAGVAPATL